MRTKIRAIAALLVLAAWSRADAIPVFARKYGVSCTACHDAWPILNTVGVNFRDNGYQFLLGKDAPTEIRPEYVPIALRTTPMYQATRVTNQPATVGGAPAAITTRSGGVTFPGVDILTAGTISEDVSFLLVISGFADGGPNSGAVESGWARLNRIAGSPWLNLRLGKMELDLPASAHRGIALSSGYSVYGAHPMGSPVTFDMSENQWGVELTGHDARSYTRYALSLSNADSGAMSSSNGWSAPLLYGHFQQTFATDSPIVPYLRVGVLGALGWWPTQFGQVCDTAAPPNCTPIPGTGSAHKQYARLGAEVSATLGYPSTPFIVTAFFMHGREDAGLATGLDPVTGNDLSTAANSFNGGFVEIDWVPYTEASYVGTPWVIFAKWDAIRYDHGAGNLDGGTLGVRRYLVMGPRAAAAIHLEVPADRVRRAGESPGLSGFVDPTTGVGKDVLTQSVIAGIDFDF